MESQQSDQHQPHFKVPKLQHPASSAASALPLPFSDSTHARFPSCGEMVGFFSLAQWKELELQALIYKYMLAGAPVPLELVLTIRKSLLLSTAPPYYHHQLHYQHFSHATAMLQPGYWGRGAIDPEPGRCRRTDGKKWRCSREVVPGQKYCERHVHRGRNRSRKHVEIPTSAGGGGLKPDLPSAASAATTKLGILPVSHSFSNRECQPDKTDGHLLRKFLDEWPRTRDNDNNTYPTTCAIRLSIAIPGNSSSDVSLKLSTGSSSSDSNNHNDLGPDIRKDDGHTGLVLVHQPPPLVHNWSDWVNHGEASMGGPLAEALGYPSSSSAVSSTRATVVTSEAAGFLRVGV